MRESRRSWERIEANLMAMRSFHRENRMRKRHFGTKRINFRNSILMRRDQKIAQ